MGRFPPFYLVTMFKMMKMMMVWCWLLFFVEPERRSWLFTSESARAFQRVSRAAHQRAAIKATNERHCKSRPLYSNDHDTRLLLPPRDVFRAGAARTASHLSQSARTARFITMLLLSALCVDFIGCHNYKYVQYCIDYILIATHLLYLDCYI